MNIFMPDTWLGSAWDGRGLKEEHVVLKHYKNSLVWLMIQNTVKCTLDTVPEIEIDWSSTQEGHTQGNDAWFSWKEHKLFLEGLYHTEYLTHAL